MYRQQLDDSLHTLPGFLALCVPHIQSQDLNQVEYYIAQLEDYARLLMNLERLAHDELLSKSSDAHLDEQSYIRWKPLMKLNCYFLCLRDLFRERLRDLRSSNAAERRASNTNVLVTVARAPPPWKGRPKYNITPDMIEPFRELHFTWSVIAAALGIDRSTLWRHVREEQFAHLRGYSTIDDEELDLLIIEIKVETPNSGESMIIGALRGRGVNVQRVRVREALSRIDPAGRALRRRRVIYRRRYSVPFSNYIWHVDGNHKLIQPWGFVIHGGIDGYSRRCVYLRCSTNNKAETVLESFEEAAELYGYPDRIRCDFGTENLDIADLMLRVHSDDGYGRGRVLTGLSVHNQRIERLWRDVVESVTSLYSEFFSNMEDQRLVDPCDPVHVVAIRFVYCPRINRTLQEFMRQWNNHPMRTMNNLSPGVVWQRGLLLRQRPLWDERLNTIQLEDDDDPVPEIQTDNNVQVPDLPINVPEDQLDSHIDPLDDSDGMNGVIHFMDAVNLVREYLAESHDI